MTTPRPPFPDVERAVCVLLGDLADTVTELPGEIQTALPLLFVYRFTGRDDGITDRPTVGVDSFAGTRAEALDHAELARQRLLAGPHSITVDDVVTVLDVVSTGEGPHRVPWGDSKVRRFASSYVIAARRSRTTP